MGEEGEIGEWRVARRFERRPALVSGAGNGIGRAVALALARDGAAVGVLDRDAAAADATAAAIAAEGGCALSLAGDVRDAADAARAVGEVVRRFGGLDLLVNAAGVLRSGATDELDEATWDLVMDTNAKGTFLLTRHALPQLRRGGRGAIVNVASMLAFASLPGLSAYAASKGAIVSFTQAVALDGAADGVRANCVAPASVRTPMLRAAAAAVDADPEQTLAAWGRAHPLGRLIEPEEVARLVLFLLSDDASALTGGCHRVDQGVLSRVGL